jgi:hypothetical protein
MVNEHGSRHGNCQTWLALANRAEPRRLCPHTSDIDLFGYGKGVVNLDAKVPYGTFNFSVPK